MTLYRFNLFPKTCDRCGRRFLFEIYDIYYIMVGIEHYSLKCYICRQCMKGKKVE